MRIFHAGPDSMYNYSETSVFASIDKKYKMFEPNALTLSKEIADVVIYGHIHTQMLNKIYNRTLVSCGSIGNNLDYVRNDNKDGNVLNTTCASYVIVEGVLDAKEYGSLNIEFVQVPYNIDKELEESKDLAEYDAFHYELKYGKYRESKKIETILKNAGIDVDLI